MSELSQYAYCAQNICFEVKPPHDGEAKVATTDPRLAHYQLAVATLSGRIDLITQSINSCDQCQGDVTNCMLRNTGK
jgi:hypothetical protein